MPNGADCSALLQTEALTVPTQWVIVDATPGGVVEGWLPPEGRAAIDLVRLPRPASPPPAAGLKRALIEVRPALTRFLLERLRERRSASAGRLVVWVVGDLGDPYSREALLELPLDLANLAFWEAGAAPGVIRAAWGGDEPTRRDWLACLRPQYFELPDFSRPWHGEHRPGQIYGNAFDATLLAADAAALEGLVARLAGLHAEESAHARAHLDRTRAGGVIVIEAVMAASQAWRRVDWLALAMYPFFPRLWDLARGDLLELLEVARCPARGQDPWAALRPHERERDWDALGLPGAAWDPLEEEEPYRITPGDHRARLALGEFLRQLGQLEEAKAQCLVGSAEARAGFEPRWLRLEGLVRLGLGETERGGELLASYRDALAADPAPTAGAMDEIATMYLVTGEWESARAWALRALERDAGLLHAYDTLVLAGRATGQADWEEEARERAARQGVQVPLHVREATERALRAARPVEPGEEDGTP